MQLHLLCLIVFSLLSLSAMGQRRYEIKGQVLDSSRSPAAEISVSLICNADTISIFSNREGFFKFTYEITDSFQIWIPVNNGQALMRVFRIQNAQESVYHLPAIILPLRQTRLSEVIVKAESVSVQEDTVEYKASAYKVREGALIEDVIRKLPGVSVDRDGQVTAYGQQVTKVRVNGKDFFGGDVQAALKNLPANVVSTIQIIDDYGDKAALSGIKSGSSDKIINISTQKGKNNGSFGQVSAGGGTKDRYLGSLNFNRFHEDRQITFLAGANNTNAPAFSFGSQRGRSGITSGGGNGVISTQSFGLNYRDAWSNKVSVYGSYSFSRQQTNNNSYSYQQDFNPFNIRTTQRSNQSSSSAVNHRFTWNLEYRIDSQNFLKVMPNLGLSHSVVENSGYSDVRRPRFRTQTDNSNTSSNTSLSGGAQMIFNHKFRKRGRNLNLSGGWNYSDQQPEREIRNQYLNTDSAGVDTSFTTPYYSRTIQHLLCQRLQIGDIDIFLVIAVVLLVGLVLNGS